MPQAIALVVAAVGLTGVGAAIATTVITLAVTFGLQKLFAPKTPKPSDGRQIIREAVSSRRRHYGRVHVGGTLSFYESAVGTLGLVITTGTGRINQIVEHRLNNKVVTLSGGVVSGASFRGAVKIYSRLGTDDQTSITELGALFPGWTANHRQRGCSHIAMLCGPVKQKHFSEVYEGNRQPEYSQVIEGALVYDPRKDSTNGGSGTHRLSDSATWQYSDNAALIIGDYWAHADGYGVGAANVNWANIASEANICDETLTTVDAQTIKRWRIWASYSLASDERRSVLSEMMKACDAFSWQDQNGLLNLRVGRWTAPTIALNDNHIISLNASYGPKAQERVNEVKIVYTDERFDYGEQESAPVVDLPAQTALGRPESQRLDVYYCPHHNQAVRLGKRMLAKLGERWNLTVTVNLYGLNLIGERFTHLTFSDLNIDADFEITSMSLDLETSLIQIGLIEVRKEDWDFNSELEEGAPPAEPGSTFVPPTVPVPTGLDLTAVALTIGETNGVGIQATWDDPAREGLEFIAQFRATSGDWLDMNVNQDDRIATSPIVASGVVHEVRVKAYTIAGRESDWSATASITPTADNSVPSAPTGLDALGGVGEADILWRNPNQASFAFARLFRNTVNNLGTATQVGPDRYGGVGEIAAVHDMPLAAGTYYYWVRAYNAAAAPSVATGPDTATVT